MDAFLIILTAGVGLVLCMFVLVIAWRREKRRADEMAARAAGIETINRNLDKIARHYKDELEDLIQPRDARGRFVKREAAQ